MLHQRQMHTHEVVAQLGPLGGALRQPSQLGEHRPRAAPVLRIVLLMHLLVLIHVVRPLWSVSCRLRVRGMRPGRRVRDGRGTHSPR
ncbi:hypothetical protein SVIO_071060 [Streptomyces violaceusniger]|uniref:Uncharacterized protein n=1 Tax=Streptomyces violaceusniger TaxID=68280 RepID=A0A4D4LEF5_STRVO|nr:hypothetical protein SVIO_071060 [Streptomyces violaceusniger]